MINQRPADLPEFDKPPVTEVLLSLQFASVPFRTYHSGALREAFSEYPVISEQMPLPPAFETFGAQANTQMINFPLSIEAFGVSVPRYWLQSADQSDLLQFQSDRLIQNWMSKPGGADYPRYERFKAVFIDRVKKVEELMAELNLGEIVPNQCEVTYVNHIEIPDGTSDPRAHLEKIFRVWSNEYADNQGREIETANIQFRYVLKDETGSPYGRLYSVIAPAVRPNGTPTVQFTLTARGRPKKETVESAFEFFDEGRSAVVKAFSSMTRPEMHKIWEKKNG